MGNITLAIPEDVHKEMKKFTDIRWSEVARRAIVEKVDTLKLADKLASKSKLTKKDVEEFTRKIKIEGTKKFLNAKL